MVRGAVRGAGEERLSSGQLGNRASPGSREWFPGDVRMSRVHVALPMFHGLGDRSSAARPGNDPGWPWTSLGRHGGDDGLGNASDMLVRCVVESSEAEICSFEQGTG